MKEEGREGLYTDDTIRTMEKKAINFIVNEYLLQINNKLTAVTFSEENEDQVMKIFTFIYGHNSCKTFLNCNLCVLDFETSSFNLRA